MPNKVIDTNEARTSTIIREHGYNYCDVEEGDDEAWLSSITNDEWDMSAECMWGPCSSFVAPTTSTTSVVGRTHELDDCDDSGTSTSKVVGRTHERDVSDDSGTSTSKVVALNHEPDDSGKSKV